MTRSEAKVKTRPEALSSQQYRRELISWSLLAVALGALEGGVIGVMLKDLFAGTFSSRTLNYSVALLTGAPHFCGLVSFFWARLAHGRDVLGLLVRFQVATALCLVLVAVAPTGVAGLPMMVAGAVGARLFWSGIVTLRAPVWRRMYPRETRARLTGTFFSLHSVVMSVTGLTVGFLVDVNPTTYPLVYVVAAVIGIGGGLVFRTLRLPNAEQETNISETREAKAGTRASWKILREDRRFSRYLWSLSAVHSGNLMLLGPLIVIMTDHLHVAQRQQVMITSSIPLVLIPFTTPLWARLFDGGNVLRFQTVNSASFALAILVFGTGAVSGQIAWLWGGAVLLGIAYAGGSVGWHLGTNHFAPKGRTLQYMGLHVSLSGFRGLLAPLAGMTLYEIIEASAAGRGAWILLLPLTLCMAGAAGFARLEAREAGRQVPMPVPAPRAGRPAVVGVLSRSRAVALRVAVFVVLAGSAARGLGVPGEPATPPPEIPHPFPRPGDAQSQEEKAPPLALDAIVQGEGVNIAPVRP